MNENFKRVLVTSDFSELGDHAIGHAFRVAADHGAEVVLCHVIETLATPNPLYAHYYATELFQPEMRRQVEQQARDALLERVPKEGALGAVRHREVVVEGDPVSQILRVARDEKADLLVIATHGRAGVKHFLLGSVVERVIRGAQCPVLVIR
jgi:nucleotide-binding universal stress UspA family protein